MKFNKGGPGPRDGATMPFGKHKGTLITELPDGYLMWCVDNLEDKPSLHFVLCQEFESRFQPNRVGSIDPAMRKLLPDFIRLGFKSLAHKVHPDKGGTNEDMRHLIKLKEFLEGL